MRTFIRRLARVRPSVALLATATMLMVPAFAVGGHNGFTLLGVLAGIGSVAVEVGHQLRIAPLMDGEYSRLDRMDGLGGPDA